MSLINQMLKDLDARRSEVTGTDAYGHQIRAVPERPRSHAAWWIALVLGVLLVAVLAWVVLHRAPAAIPAQTVVKPHLPLKLDGDLDSEQPPLTEKSVVEAPSAAVAITGTPTTLVVQETEAMPIADGARREAAPAPQKSAAEEKPFVSPQEPKSVPATSNPEQARPAAAAKSLAATPIAKPSDHIAPISINKQVKELTSQQRAENEYRKALLLVQQGRTTEALGGLEQALQLEPIHAAARQALIGLLLENKRQDDGLRKASEGLNLDPAQPGLAMILARLQLEKGELRPAIETLLRTLPYAADKPDYQSFVAALLQRDGRNKEAIEHYLQALQIVPQNGVWWMGLGISLQAESRFAEAQEAFSRAKATNALSPELLAFVEARLRQLQR